MELQSSFHHQPKRGRTNDDLALQTLTRSRTLGQAMLLMDGQDDDIVEKRLVHKILKTKTRKQREYLERKDPYDSPWYKEFVQPPFDDPTREAEHQYETVHRRKKEFRGMFRMPRTQYRDICVWFEENKFYKKDETDAVGRKSSPVRLLILTSLNFLGRNNLPDNMRVCTGMSGQVIRKFFQEVFVVAMAEHFYPRHVRAPLGLMVVLAGGGTHLVRNMTYQNLRVPNTGKEGVPTRTSLVTVNFRREIFDASGLFPGKTNDAILSRYNKFIRSLKDHNYDDFTWNRYNADGVVQQMRGPYLIVDGGFGSHAWCLVSASSTPENDEQANMATWIGSVRKCIECTFGIVKKRFVLLENYLGHDDGVFEKIWFTCLGLHNFLLKIDGLDKPFPRDEQSRDAEISNFEESFMIVPQNASLIPGEEVGNDLDPEMDVNEENDGVDLEEQQNAVSLEDSETIQLSDSNAPQERQEEFREKLAQHWAYRVKQNQVCWPSRSGPSLLRINGWNAIQ